MGCCEVREVFSDFAMASVVALDEDHGRDPS
jgi:hypothetical protein